MRQDIYSDVKSRTKSEEDQRRIYMMTAFSQKYKNQEVPDPYYGGTDGFEHVLDMLEDSCAGLLKEIDAAASKQKRSR